MIVFNLDQTCSKGFFLEQTSLEGLVMGTVGIVHLDVRQAKANHFHAPLILCHLHFAIHSMVNGNWNIQCSTHPFPMPTLALLDAVLDGWSTIVDTKKHLALVNYLKKICLP